MPRRAATLLPNLPPFRSEALAQAARPRTLVDQVVDSLVESAAKGLILPGERIVETDIARALNVSRVPVREALRLLESQGIFTSEPYKGIRLMNVTSQRLHHILKVRASLEKLAVQEAIELGRNRDAGILRLERVLEEMAELAKHGDNFGLAKCDAEFHRTLCALSGNEPLSAMWETLARQLTIIFGLSSFEKPLDVIVAEHVTLTDRFRRGDPAALERALDDHIIEQVEEVDFADIIARKREAKR